MGNVKGGTVTIQNQNGHTYTISATLTSQGSTNVEPGTYTPISNHVDCFSGSGGSGSVSPASIPITAGGTAKFTLRG